SPLVVVMRLPSVWSRHPPLVWSTELIDARFPADSEWGLPSRDLSSSRNVVTTLARSDPASAPGTAPRRRYVLIDPTSGSGPKSGISGTACFTDDCADGVLEDGADDELKPPSPPCSCGVRCPGSSSAGLP